MEQELNARFYDAATGLDVKRRVVLAGDQASGYSASSPDLPGCVAAARARRRAGATQAADQDEAPTSPERS